MRGLVFAAVAALLPMAGGVLAAPQIKQPECGPLEAWGSHVNAENFNVAPRLPLPKALEDAQIVPLFGVGVPAWTQEDLQAANQLLTKCYGEAGKRRDTAAAGALANANRTLQGWVPRTNAALQKAKADAEPLEKQIAALLDSPELDRGLVALFKGNPAQPDAAPFRTLPREVADPLWRLAAQVLPLLANGERERLFKALDVRHAAIQSGMASATEKAIAAAPADADGMLQLMTAEQHLAALDDANAKAQIEKRAADRLKEIGGALRQAKPAVWVPPSCLDLYRWSGANGANGSTALGNQGVMTAFLDERVVPVFGISVADWSDQDVARFKTLRGLCRGALEAQAALPGASASELVQLGNRGRWIDGADAQIANAKTAIAAHRGAEQALAAALEKLHALPDTSASLGAMAQLAQDPAFNQMSPDERARFAKAIEEKRAAIGAHATDAAVKGLGEVKVASLGDLRKLLAYGGQTMQTIPDPRGRQTFEAAFRRSVEEAMARLLPEFKAKLDAIPVSLASVAEANAALAKLTGIPDAERAPLFKAYVDAAKVREDAIRKAARNKACEEYTASIGAAGDAKQALWEGQDGITLGDFLCQIAEHNNKVEGYSGPGLLSSSSTLKVSPVRMAMLTITLNKAEVRAGKPMLVGTEVKDASQVAGHESTQQITPTPIGKISVEQWEFLLPNLIGFNGSEEADCMKTYKDPAPDKFAPAAKLSWLYCTNLPQMRLRIAAGK